MLRSVFLCVVVLERLQTAPHCWQDVIDRSASALERVVSARRDHRDRSGLMSRMGGHDRFEMLVSNLLAPLHRCMSAWLLQGDATSRAEFAAVPRPQQGHCTDCERMASAGRYVPSNVCGDASSRGTFAGGGCTPCAYPVMRTCVK